MNFCISIAYCLSVLLAGGEDPAAPEAAFLTKVRQLTFEGKRAGEGYFSADGQMLVFQSERMPENPFYQIYLLDLETGDVDRVSPGHGKTTCSWIHPKGDRVLFASTHLDPAAIAKQKEELEFRASGQERRYSWDYDENFDLFEWRREVGDYKRLTKARGYDAEGNYSPDGKTVVFASNRHGYTETLLAEDSEIFERDKSYMMEIYSLDLASGKITRLTDTKGYDGGPFFSADGKRICWRRFAPDGATAEIFSMNPDGSDQRQLTRLGAMSWAPYFHPSGEYLIFATNLQGFANFELYLVDAAGANDPVRVTFTDGFDGLAAFSPDGGSLAWTSNRTAGKTSQIFMGAWNHEAARAALGIKGTSVPGPANQSPPMALPHTSADILPADLRGHVEALAGEATQGRMTGSAGAALAERYVADTFQRLGLAPAGDDGTYFQKFPFVAGVSLGPQNRLTVDGKNYQADRDWRPLSFSRSGETAPAGVVFAGYGLQAPADGDQVEYDSYVHLDVTGKWVLVLRYFPEDIDEKKRSQLVRFADLRYKAMQARDHGAAGLMIATGPRAKVSEELVELSTDVTQAGTSLPVISISNALAEELIKAAGKDLGTLQESLDKGEPMMGFELPGSQISAAIDIQQEKREGRNVLAVLARGDHPGGQVVAIGAHLDHLGHGEGGGSLARGDERGKTHYGADDNASGIAGLLEVAEYLSAQKALGRLEMNRDILFAAWSGEELGLIGSSHFVGHYPGLDGDKPQAAISAYLNMDMIGRLNKEVVMQGLGSSPFWAGEIERRNAPIGLSIVTQNDAFLPTDATSFYLKGVPILSAFTGSHADYHTPRDTPDKLNYDGMGDIAKFMGLVVRSLAGKGEPPEFNQVVRKAGEGKEHRAMMRAYLGTIPDYAAGDQPGLKLSGVSKGGPAEKAGLVEGDLIVELAGRKVENIYDYTYAIEALKIGVPTKVVVIRNGKKLEIEVTPGSRE